MDILGLLARVALGAVLLFAGFSKLRSRRWPILAVEAGVPRAVVLTLPAGELMLGVVLVGQVVPSVFGWCAVVLFAAFLIVVTVQVLQGSEASCNCFGGDGESVVSWSTVLRNVAFLAIAVIGAVF